MGQNPEAEVCARLGSATLPLLPLDRGSPSTPDSGLEPQIQVCCLGRDHSAREMYLTNWHECLSRWVQEHDIDSYRMDMFCLRTYHVKNTTQDSVLLSVSQRPVLALCVGRNL